jgi:hypothetical protein
MALTSPSDEKDATDIVREECLGSRFILGHQANDFNSAPVSDLLTCACAVQYTTKEEAGQSGYCHPYFG